MRLFVCVCVCVVRARVACIAANPIDQWSVDETQEWIAKFEDWVEDSVLVSEHRIDGQTLVR
jgi:hypothetical protein